MKILFVCTGNTCRSSMAAGLAKDIVKKRNLEQTIEIISAGTMAWPGSPATAQAVQALAEKNIDINDHQASMLTDELITTADLILTMTAGHRQQVLQKAPETEKKVYTLCQYAEEEGDIPDPYGQPLPVYQACAARLEQLITKALDKIINNAGKK
ncbi:low molecular weight protein arginine phosphatase [Peptococcaceae bacterium 1198_IL3148]